MAHERAARTTFVEQVGDGGSRRPASSSTSRARSSIARVMSADIGELEDGRLPTPPSAGARSSCGRSRSAGRTRSAARAPRARPSGTPVPERLARRPPRRCGPRARCPDSAARSMPRSRAIRRASGEALTRPSARVAGSSPGRNDLATRAALGVAPGAREPSSSTASSTPRRPGRAPGHGHLLALLADHGDRSCPPRPRPRGRRSSGGRREASASTSCVTLSVSSS